MNKTRNILMTTNTTGGIWNYSLELIAALEPYNIEVILAVMGRPLSSSQILQAAQTDNLTIVENKYISNLPYPGSDDMLATGLWIEQLVKEFKPDVLHLNHYVQNDSEWQIPVVTVCHSCAYSWQKAVHQSFPAQKSKNYYHSVKRCLENSDAVVGTNKSILNETLDIYQISGVTGHVIHNGVQQQNYVVNEKDPILFTNGRIWDEAQNIYLLECLGNYFNGDIYIAGENIHPVSGEQTKLQNTRWVGQLSNDELRSYLTKAAIYTSPVVHEPFGLSVLEAACSGCALLLSDIPAFRELWEGAAIFVNPYDVELWEEASNLLLRDEALRLKMGSHAKSQSIIYTAKKMGSGYVELYEQVIDQGSSKTTSNLLKENLQIA